MKHFLSLLIFLFSIQLFAQPDKTYEIRLNDHYKKTQKNYYQDEITSKEYQRILDENDIFTAELIYYLKTQPSSITNSFCSLVKNNFTITTSPDGNFRIYSWAINLGGRDDFVYNIFQYSNKNTSSVWADKENNYEGNHIIDVFETKLNGKQYYFPYTLSPTHESIAMQFVDNFRVSKYGISNEDKLFKVGKDAESSFIIGFDFFSVLDNEKRPIRLIKFDAKTNTFTVPYINPRTLKVSRTKTEKYKFNGKYFE